MRGTTKMRGSRPPITNMVQGAGAASGESGVASAAREDFSALKARRNKKNLTAAQA